MPYQYLPSPSNTRQPSAPAPNRARPPPSIPRESMLYQPSAPVPNNARPPQRTAQSIANGAERGTIVSSLATTATKTPSNFAVRFEDHSSRPNSSAENPDSYSSVKPPVLHNDRLGSHSSVPNGYSLIAACMCIQDREAI